MIIYRNVSLVLCAVLITVYGVLNIRLNEAIISNQESVIRDIESQTMLDIPPDVEILSTDDGGGRDPSYNYMNGFSFSVADHSPNNTTAWRYRLSPYSIGNQCSIN